MQIVIKEKMSEAEAMAVAKQLTRASTLLKFYLGRLWNATDADTKLLLIEEFGYAPSTMRGLGTIVKKYPKNFEQEFVSNSSITFSHFDFAARSKDPVKTLRTAAANKMTCTEVLELTKQDTEKVKKRIEKEELEAAAQLPYEEPVSTFEYKQNSQEVTKRKEVAEKVVPQDVFDYFGIIPGKVTKEVYSLLYRNASKNCHPDTGGTDEDFLRFAQVSEYFSKYVVD